MDPYIITALLTTLGGFIAYLVRTQMQRLDTLEQLMPTKTSEAEVRQLVADKVDPIKESMSEIKDKVDKVIDLLLQNKS